MKITSEVCSWNDFDFWSGTTDTVNYLNTDEIEQIFVILEDAYPDGMTDTELNDFFWFETDTIAQWLGYNCWEDIVNGEE